MSDEKRSAMASPTTSPRRINGFMLTTVRHTPQTMQSWVAEQHRDDELVWSTTGVMRVHAADAVWTVPAHRGVWLPAETPHTIEAAGDTLLYATFVKRGAVTHLPRVPVMVELLPAIRELLLLNAAAELPDETRMRLQQLVVDLLHPTPEAQVDLRLPLTPRLLSIAEKVIADPSEGTTTEEWADRVGIPSRELSRMFAAETGFTLTQWRIRARVRASLVLLASGHTVVGTARRLGYANATTFIAHFKSIVGSTPAVYFSGRAQ